MSRTIRRFMQFSRTASTLDMRPDYETRLRRAERYAKRNRTEANGKARYALDYELPQPLCHGLGG